jgi:DNA-binding CsgD family transcriptional regulator
MLAGAIDPMRSLLAAARLVPGATSGVVLHDGGRTGSLPGLTGHPLLAPDSPALEPARGAIAAGQIHTSFLWPVGGRSATQAHVRLTALAGTEDGPVIAGMVLVSPPGKLRGLTPRELEVLGLLIDGRCNHEIATSLGVSRGTVAAHVEHILAKLGASTRTLAAVRAQREGLYVPPRARARPEGAP